MTKPKKAGDRTADGKMVVRWETRHVKRSRLVNGFTESHADRAAARNGITSECRKLGCKVVRIVRPDWRARALAAEAELAVMRKCLPGLVRDVRAIRGDAAELAEARRLIARAVTDTEALVDGVIETTTWFRDARAWLARQKGGPNA